MMRTSVLVISYKVVTYIASRTLDSLKTYFNIITGTLLRLYTLT
ncbi:MAG: hypothetical protein QXZ48_07150 [Zestosphaera sp.]